MHNMEKYQGIIPAFYACYDKEGNISPQAVRDLAQYFGVTIEELFDFTREER